MHGRWLQCPVRLSLARTRSGPLAAAKARQRSRLVRRHRRRRAPPRFGAGRSCPVRRRTWRRPAGARSRYARPTRPPGPDRHQRSARSTPRRAVGRTAGQRRDDLGRGQHEPAGSLPDLVVHGVEDRPAPHAAEQPPVRSGAEGVDVVWSSSHSSGTHGTWRASSLARCLSCRFSRRPASVQVAATAGFDAPRTSSAHSPPRGGTRSWTRSSVAPPKYAGAASAKPRTSYPGYLRCRLAELVAACHRSAGGPVAFLRTESSTSRADRCDRDRRQPGAGSHQPANRESLASLAGPLDLDQRDDGEDHAERPGAAEGRDEPERQRGDREPIPRWLARSRRVTGQPLERRRAVIRRDR